MDVFFEQIIRKKPNAVQKIVKFGFIATTIVLIGLLVFFAVMLIGTIFSPLCMLACVGIGYGAIWYVKRMYMEYEYSITNGDFDIDRIIGKSKRERIISTNCKEFQEFGAYGEIEREKLSNREFNAKVMAANLEEEGLYYAVVDHKKVGLVLLVIQPDDRIKSALKKFIPRIIQNDVFGN